MRCIVYIPRVLAGTCVLAGMCGLSIHIYTGVGLSALLVSICRAMREPFYRGTSNRNRSTLFCLCMINEETRTATAGATGHTNRNDRHMAQELNVGSYLQNGKYRIIGMLGQGGFGITYLAVQSGLERKVAIKEFFMKEFCNRDGSTSHVTLGTEGSRETVARFREKFLKEARNIARLNHPHIVRIHDIFEENGTAYYVMEYAEGGSLADLVKSKGCLSEPEATIYILQIAEALAYIHGENMNHLDVKPANILLNDRNEAILIDFGLSKQYDALTGGQTSTTPVGISEGYAPMEQYKQGGVSEFSPETDIYALGATYFKLLTGKTPPSASDVFEDGAPVDELKARGVSQEAICVIKNAMEPKKKDRMKDVRLFLALKQDSNSVSSSLPRQHPVVVEDDEATVVATDPAQMSDEPQMVSPIASADNPQPNTKCGDESLSASSSVSVDNGSNLSSVAKNVSKTSVFSFNGRVGRKGFWLTCIPVFGALAYVYGCGFSLYLYYRIGYGSNELLFGLFILFCCYVFFSVGVKRCHDLGFSGWCLLIPVFNLIPLSLCLLKKGEAKDNKWGAMEGRGLSLGSVIVACVVFAILFISVY